MRAIVDSDILRFPRQNIRRLLERWPAMLQAGRSLRRFQSGAASRKRKGYGKILCLMPLSHGVPCEEFSSVCAETISKKRRRTSAASMSIGWRRRPMKAAFRHLSRVFRMSSFSTPDGGSGSQSLEVLSRPLDRARGQFSYVIVEAHRQIHGGSADRDHPAKPVRLSHSTAERGESFELNLLAREARARGCEAIPIKPLVFLDAAGCSRRVATSKKRSDGRFIVTFGRPETASGSLRIFIVWGVKCAGARSGLFCPQALRADFPTSGVLQVLEENGIEVDIVAGSSMGAYIGAVWGAGYGGREMEKFAREIEGYRGLWRLMDLCSFSPPRISADRSRVRKRLRRNHRRASFF